MVHARSHIPKKTKKPKEKRALHSGSVTPGSVTHFAIKGRIWVDGPEGTFIGYGRVVLMERIKEHGSITKAAKSMSMSYRHAWELVDSMNRQAPEPFVVTSTGGQGGGGTVVTKHGDRAIKKFWKSQDALTRFLEKEGAKYEFAKDSK